MSNKNITGVFSQRPKEINKEPVKVRENIVRCANCDRQLVSMHEVIEIKSKNSVNFVERLGETTFEKKNESIPTVYKFTCPDCDGCSFKQKINGKPFMEAIDCKIVDITQEEDLWLVKLKKAL